MRPGTWCPPTTSDNARLIVSQVLVETIDALKLHYPAPAIGPKELKAIRKALAR